MRRLILLAVLTASIISAAPLARAEGVPVAVPPGPPNAIAPAPKITASATIVRFRRVQVLVNGPASVVGERVQLRDGRHVRGDGVFEARGSASRATIQLPLPKTGRGSQSLAVWTDGAAATTVMVPDLDASRRDWAKRAPFLFDALVFTGDEFPDGDFEEPSVMEDAIGRYQLTFTFYDASYNRVTAPTATGRYGAVVRVRPERGSAFERYVTLYRRDKLAPSASSFNLTGTLAPEFGIDPAVLTERSELWGEYLGRSLAMSTWRDARSAMLLAGLHEARPGDGTGLWNNAYRVDDNWWYGLKKKLGAAHMPGYLVDLPADYATNPARQWPLMIFLHGSGERGTDLNLLRKHGPPKMVAQGKQFPFILVSPQAAESAVLGAQIAEILQQVEAKYRVDADRVYLTGLSLGGSTTWNAGLEHPELFAAIAPMASSGDPGGVPRLKNVAVWFFVGGKDPGINQERVTQTVAAMKAAGLNYKFTLYSEAGHQATWEQAYADPALYDWLLAQKRPGTR